MTNSHKILTLTVHSSTKHLSEVRDFIGDYVKTLGLPQREISEIQLAVDEAYTNIIKHAYKNIPSNLVKVEIGASSTHLCISIYDKGESFKPNQYKAPDILKRVKNYISKSFNGV